MINKKLQQKVKQHTILGLIPAEWWFGTVQDLVDQEIIYKPMDGNHGSIHPKASDYVDDGVPFVMANNIIDGKLDLSSCSFLTQERADSLQKGFSKTGDILLTHKGSVGGTAVVPGITTPYLMLTPQVTYYRAKDFEKIEPLFIKALFMSERFQALLERLSGGGTRAYIGITAQRLLPFLMPSVVEQKRIVRVLKTWDEAIGKLDRMIELKKDVKKGLMQKLLTGELRLPGFSEKWKSYEFLELFDVLKKPTGYKSEDYNPEGAIPIIDQSYHKRISGYTDEIENSYDFSNKAVVVFGDHSRVIKYINGLVAFGNDGIKLFQSKDSIKIKFGYYLLKNYRIPETGYNRHFKYLENAVFTIPSTKEQSSIEEVLSASDAEIEILKNKLKCLRDQKKYLLNNLVTGQIRTPENL